MAVRRRVRLEGHVGAGQRRELLVDRRPVVWVDILEGVLAEQTFRFVAQYVLDGPVDVGVGAIRFDDRDLVLRVLEQERRRFDPSHPASDM
nr:hypothetical protein [Halomicroarcula sp. SYNS111]